MMLLPRGGIILCRCDGHRDTGGKDLNKYMFLRMLSLWNLPRDADPDFWS